MSQYILVVEALDPSSRGRISEVEQYVEVTTFLYIRLLMAARDINV